MKVTKVDYFSKVKDRKALKEWAMKHYFNPSRKEEKWYSSSVNSDNVFDYISNPSNSFPYTPNEFISFWENIKSARKALKTLKVKNFDKEEIEPTKRGRYRKGEEVLRNIIPELGGITSPMIGKIIDNSFEKIKKLTGGVNLLNNSDVDVETFEEAMASAQEKIDKAKFIVSNKYASKLSSFKNNSQGFIEALMKENILTKNDLIFISNLEKEYLDRMSVLDKEDIAAVVLEDSEQKQSLFKTFQYCVSKYLYPPKKRGRPKKVK